MTMTPDHAQWFAQTFSSLVGNVGQVVLGKPRTISLAVTCLLSEGHLLLEDFPGTGKTSLAKALAGTVQGKSSRIQFTPDLLPSDVTGVTIWDQKRNEFEFHQGPIFAQIVLADEINRASPKTQSALLEVMEESKVTVDGVSHAVGNPFMVIATQNPIEQAGTYRLPEAQLDRFLMKTSLGYPDHAATVEILAGAGTKAHQRTVAPKITPAAVVDMAELAATVHTDPAVLDYVVRIAEASRQAPETTVGVSVRGCLALVRASRTWAAAHGRHYVIPDDVKDLAEPVLAHRIMLDAEAEFAGTTVASVVHRILGDITPPQQRGA
ncbi:MoxR family ATPase [Nakamurella sp. A5-74]|uniref:MoxR family ATPase n=1 Tax=Nakamurella sp. A5-74 TaxID=3158264 RepID=A0AAU8DSU4_9ACTN